jgi:hypothetical protein
LTGVGARAYAAAVKNLRRFSPWLLIALCGPWGCSSGPSPEALRPPPAAAGSEGLGGLVVGGPGDSIASIPGRPDAPYRYRFRQIEPASGGFNFQDRDLSFYFRPSPDALHFQVENRQNRPVWIEWERSTFLDPSGRTDKLAHRTTTFEDRFKSQPNTQIPGLQRYSDYLLPTGYLLDAAGSDQQVHRPLLPEDATSPQYTDRIFGVDLAMIVEDRSRTYTFRFRVASVIPR